MDASITVTNAETEDKKLLKHSIRRPNISQKVSLIWFTAREEIMEANWRWGERVAGRQKRRRKAKVEEE